VEVPPLKEEYAICKRFSSSLDTEGEVTVCLEKAKVWHEKKKGRVVATDLALINTGVEG
jgi:hypothetical protein